MKKVFETAMLLMILIFPAVTSGAAAQSVSLADLKPGDTVGEFRFTWVYLNDADQPMGARFVHLKTGFTLDLLQIESVPQGFVWVNTLPISDKGEPHTQEHLLLGKGKMGRTFSGFQTMAVTNSSAFTEQWRTAYDFNTASGPDVFYQLFDKQMDALLHPDYSDEEIRREVRNFGVAENPDGTLRLEEKGTVYNEMVSSSDHPFEHLFRAMDQALYGKDHPLSYNSGGEPASLRIIKPEDIRKFHMEHYRLENMGMLGSFPKTMTVTSVLDNIGPILDRLEGDRKPATIDTSGRTLPHFPPAQPAAAGLVESVSYPMRNAQQPSPVMIVWPADRQLDQSDKLLLELFLQNFASDSTSNLYKIFVDSTTRQMDIGATAVFSSASDDEGQPVYAALVNVSPQAMTDANLAEIRKRVVDELRRIASMPDGSPQLAEFNQELASRVVETRRDLSKFVNSPPGFGFRNTGSDWMEQLLKLEQTSDVRKSVTLKPELASVDELLKSKKNIWADALHRWKLLDEQPLVLAAKPDPDLVTQDETDRQQRIAAEVKRLETEYGVSTEQEAIRKYKAAYDLASDEIDRQGKEIKPASFVDSPPMTLDDQLDYRVLELNGPNGGKVPLVASTFENMTSAMTGIALRLDVLDPADDAYLSMFPALLTEVGVIENGHPVPYDEMTERIRKEILSLDGSFSTNSRTSRAELVVTGAGNDQAESVRAINWMRLVLTHPDWRPENLPRIRDLVDQRLSRLRNVMQGSEESWVQGPAAAYRRQDSPLLLTTESFLTQEHNIYRLRWLLKGMPTGSDGEAISAFFTDFAGAGAELSRDELKALLGNIDGSSKTAAPEKGKKYLDKANALPAAAKAIAVDAAKDLDLTLIEIPDGSLSSDWAYLCGEMRDDLATPPSETLHHLDEIRQSLLRTGSARLFVVGSAESQKSLSQPISQLVDELRDTTAEAKPRPAMQLVKERLLARDPSARDPLFVGLIAPNMKGGVFLNSSPGTTYFSRDRESLVDYLASRLYAGYGSHGIFIKTIGAGLAYSNGLRASLSTGQNGYYAERTPELPQTLKFVIHELQSAPHDASLVDYSIAQAFSEYRSASPYETRGEAMAADLADGQTPDVVRQFRQAILQLRKEPGLSDQLYERMPIVYGRLLPGYGTPAKNVAGGVYFVIGPERQMSLYDEYLKSVEGPETHLFRLFPRDYWMVRK